MILFPEKIKKKLIYIFIILILVIIPSFIKNPYHLHIIFMVFLNSLVASGLNMVTGLTGQVSIGQAAFYGIGAYTSAIVSKNLNISFWITCPLAGFVTSFFGLVIGYPVLKLKGPYLAFATIGFGEIVRLILTNWYNLTGGAAGITKIPSPSLFKIIEFFSLTNWYYLMLFFLILTIIFVKNIINSNIGRKFKAIQDSQIGAAISGVNISYYKILAFVLSAFIAGIGGSIYAHYIKVISPDVFNFELSLWFLYMIVIGGLGTVEGPIVGAIFLTVVPEYLRLAKNYQMIIVGIIIILSAIFFPEGMRGIAFKGMQFFKTRKLFTFVKN